MEVTEVRIRLRDRGDDRKLKAYATVTFDNAFVVRDLKIIDGKKGLFVAMPSQKRREPCPKCGYRNVVGSKFCNQCGERVENTFRKSLDNRTDHRDIAHPITMEAREYIQGKILDAYETERAKFSGESVPSPATEATEEPELSPEQQPEEE